MAHVRGLVICQVQQYLRLVVEGKLPVNHDIIYELQVHPGCMRR
jgi:hypothetical protein